MIKLCKNLECRKAFETDKDSKIYCTIKCRRRMVIIRANNRKKSVGREKGWAYKAERKRYEKVLADKGMSRKPRNFKVKICDHCGESYKPTNGRQRYCDPECLINNR